MSHVEFANKVEMKNFAYEGNAGIDEENVKTSVADFLRGRGTRYRWARNASVGPTCAQQRMV
jgi:hypothetical protein